MRSVALVALVAGAALTMSCAKPAARPTSKGAKGEAATRREIASSSNESEAAHLVVDAAISAHGGHEALEAASTWVAEIRRYQRGSSYVLTNYYRPGMVRLEQDLGNGEKSADVIGDPHCWGMHGPVSIPCSPETRENDRPRVIMEMASQLWPLKGEDWVLLGAGEVATGDERMDKVTARYMPRDTRVEFVFDGATRMLRSISVEGIKGGVLGTHLHIYSDYEDYCGVKMPSHNVKSFEGEVWVEEDVLAVSCRPVEEGLFIRPPQVAEGTIVDGHADPATLVCAPDDHQASSLSAAEDELHAAIGGKRLSVIGPLQRLIFDDGRAQACVPVKSASFGDDEYLVVKPQPEADVLSIFSLQAYDEGSSELADELRAEAMRRNLRPSGPMRLLQYDNDGMGLSGELVVELQLPVDRIADN